MATVGANRADGLEAALRRELDRDSGLLPVGSRVIVALSGGPDSMALLALLRSVADDRDLRLLSAHFDHRTRPSSTAEAERVRAWSEEIGVECRVGRASPPLPAGQEELREARYGFLRELADREGADRIATGHQADDQAETVLFRILRGGGLRGLAGIPRRRGRIVRPLLSFERARLEDYLTAEQLPHLQDPSNLSRSQARARLRHELLPALGRTWDGPARERLLRIGRLAAKAEASLASLTEAALEGCGRPERSVLALPELTGGGAGRPPSGRWLDRSALLGCGEELQARILRKAARRRNVRLTEGGTRSGVEFINSGRSGGHVDLGDGLELWREFDAFWIGIPTSEPPDRCLPLTLPEGRGRFRVGGRRYEAAWGRGEPAKGFRYRQVIPGAVSPSALSYRGWKSGDRIRLEGGTRKLKDLFNERRVALSERPRVPLLAAEGGEVIWVVGLAADVRATASADENLFWTGLRHG